MYRLVIQPEEKAVDGMVARPCVECRFYREEQRGMFDYLPKFAGDGGLNVDRYCDRWIDELSGESTSAAYARTETAFRTKLCGPLGAGFEPRE